MNILYLHSHDTGRYVQPYGHTIPTPNLQRLAEQGILFRQAFCAGPTCSASRAALLTGQCPHSAGMIGLAHRGFGLHDYSQHLVQFLRRAGYTTALSGVQHEAAKPETIGYDRVLGGGWWNPETAAIEFLRQASQPFFLSVGFGRTHRTYDPAATGDDGRYHEVPPPLPDCPEVRADFACFRATATALDVQMGAVLAALDETGLAGNTLVICTTDHGIAFPAMKCNLTDHGLGVMLILRGPGEFAGGKVCDAMVSHIDIFPTICDVLRLPPPDWLQGKSLLPLIDGRATEINEEVFGEVTYHAAYEPMRAVRTKRWKYIRRFGARAKPVMPNCDDCPSKDVWAKAGWADRPLPEESLFDLLFDPNEAHNIAGDPSAGAAITEMRARLDAWMRRTNDPLLRGDVPLPAGAFATDPDAYSP